MGRLARVFKVRPGEGRMVLLLVGLMVATSAGGSIGGNGIDALFISRFGVRFLPQMYIALGFITLVTSLIIAVLLARFAREHLFVALPIVLAAALIGERFLVGTGVRWAYPVLWLGMNVTGALQALLTWGLAGVVCDTRQAKRLFPLFGAGNILGAVIGGLATPSLARIIHSENLLLVWAGTLLAAFAFGGALIGGKLRTIQAAPKKRAQKRIGFVREMRRGYDVVRSSPFLKWTAGSAALFALLLYSIAFPFSKAASARFPDADQLASFFGIFQAVSTAIAFAVSLFVANRLFARFGIMKTIVAFPLIYVAGFGTLVAAGRFEFIVGFRLVQMVWLQGVFGSAYQATYNVIPPDRKDQARAFIDGVPGQAGTVAAGVLLLVGEQALAQRTMSWIGFAAAAACIVVAAKAMRAYSGALVDALREGRPQIFLPEQEPFGGYQRDATAVAAAVAGVSNPDRTIRRVSAEILGQLSAPEATDALVRALKDRDPPVRIAALTALVHAESAGALLEIAARLYDPEAEVRAQAVDALRALARYPAGVTREIRRLLDDPIPDVRARVAVALCSFNDDAEAKAVIRSMSEGDIGDRLSLLNALGGVPVTGGIDLIQEQAEHPAPTVRRAAAKALGRIEDVAPSLLIAMLSDPDHSVLEAASENVARHGKRLLPQILEALKDPRTEIGALRALEISDLDLPADKIRDYARDVSARAVRDLDKWQAARSTSDGEVIGLLADALRHRAVGHANKAIRAVGLLSNREAVSTALDNLRSSDPAQRANALETLEGVGHREIVAPLIPLWDPEAPTSVETDGWLRKLLTDDDPWLRACAVLAIAESHDADLRAEAVRVAQSDPDPSVRVAAVRITTEHPMDTLATLSTIERVLFLKRVPIFGGLSPDDLKDVAHIAGERTYSDGEVLAEQGEPGDGLFVVVSGEVGVVIDYDTPQETEIARRTTGEYVGEMAVVTGGPRTAFIVARTDVRVMFIDRLHFESLLRERPEVSLVLMKSLVDRIQEVNRFLPHELAVKLETARGRGTIAGERRVVTMLFCDVAGSTELAEQLDPEQWAEIMNRVFGILIAPVYRYEGTLARLMGDAILAFFGAPLAHEDDPLRAVRAGLDMVKEIGPLREELSRERALDLNVRVGINTGLVVVGEIGSDLRVEYTALGDAVNVASRMEQNASPGTVQISDETQKLVAPFVELEDLGSVEVKGKREPVRAFRVLETKAEPGKARGIEGLTTPLVGRDDEVATLRRNLAEIGSGRGRIVCLVGEAGLGKSRLISELRAEWLATHGEKEGLAHWAEARADSYETATPYSQFRQAIRHLCAVGVHASPAEARERIARVVEEEGLVGSEGARMQTIWEILLGVEDEPSGLEGEDLKRAVFEVFSETIRRWGDRPSVFVADDLHWSDRASVELLLHLFSLSAELPILFLCASRPPADAIVQPLRESHAERLNEIELAPLSATEGQELVSGLIPMEHLPPQLRNLILDKSAGNPFFLEEILRSLMEQGAIVRDNGSWKVAVPVTSITVPDRVQGVLTARIDALEPAVKRTLQLAAVVGPTFHYRVLKSIVKSPDDLGDHLDKLERAGLVSETAEIPELEFSFRHPLIQEAAYESILLRERNQIHLKVGEQLEKVFAGREAEEAPTLARHFQGAEDPRALRYSSLAGDRAVRLHAHREAIDHYSTALELARANPEKADFAHLFTSLGHSCELLGDFAGAIKAYEAMRDYARKTGDRKLELRAIGAMATVRSTPNPMYDAAEARSLLEHGLELSRELGDREAEARTLWNLMLNIQFAEGTVEETLEFGERALEIARDLRAKEQTAFVLNDIAYPRFVAGQQEAALDALARAGELWAELDNQPMLVDSIIRRGDLTAQSGNPEEGVRLIEQGLEIAIRIGNDWGQSFALTNRAYALWELGHLGRAVADMSEAVRLSVAGGLVIGGSVSRSELALMLAQLGYLEVALQTAKLAHATAVEQFPIVRGWTLANLARVELAGGDPRKAREYALQAESDLPELGSTFYSFGLLRAFLSTAQVALARGDASESFKAVDKLLNEQNRMGIRWRKAEALRLRAAALELEGREEEAHEALVSARSVALDTSSKWALWQILAALADLEARRGNDQEASSHRSRAREIILGLVASLNDPRHKESFKKRPDVSALLDNPPG